MIYKLRVLSYHLILEKYDENRSPFQRTTEQFKKDLITQFDWITLDDGLRSQKRACRILRKKNFRAKIGVITSLVGQKDYLTWDELRELSKYHDIINHTHNHKDLTRIGESHIMSDILTANYIIKREIGISPRYFIPPYNKLNDSIIKLVRSLGMQTIKDRLNVKHDTILT